MTAAGLVDTLNGEGPFTVFAPNNDAFAKIPADTLASLLEPENVDQLKAVLLRHVLPTTILAGDIPEGIHLHAIMERSLTSEEIILVRREEIILERTEEVPPKTEVISQDMSREEDLGININHMDDA